MHPWKSLFISLMVIGLMPGSAGLPSRAEPAAGESPVPVTSVAEMVAGSDWERDPLEIDLLRAWDHDGVHFEELFFTGPITHGVKTRVHAFRGAPVSGAMLPGMLHAHGGGTGSEHHFSHGRAAQVGAAHQQHRAAQALSSKRMASMTLR